MHAGRVRDSSGRIAPTNQRASSLLVSLFRCGFSCQSSLHSRLVVRSLVVLLSLSSWLRLKERGRKRVEGQEPRESERSGKRRKFVEKRAASCLKPSHPSGSNKRVLSSLVL